MRWCSLALLFMSVGRWGGGIYAEGDRNMNMDDGRGRLEGGASTRAENMHFSRNSYATPKSIVHMDLLMWNWVLNNNMICRPTKRGAGPRDGLRTRQVGAHGRRHWLHCAEHGDETRGCGDAVQDVPAEASRWPDLKEKLPHDDEGVLPRWAISLSLLSAANLDIKWMVTTFYIVMVLVKNLDSHYRSGHWKAGAPHIQDVRFQ